MVYDTTLVQPKAGQPTDSVFINTVARNLDALKSGNYVQYTHTGAPASWSTTAISFVSIDTSIWRLTLTTVGRPVVVGFNGNMVRLTDWITYFGIIHWLGSPSDLKNDPLELSVTFNAVGMYLISPRQTPFSFLKVYPNLPAGTHTFDLYWASPPATANASTLDGTLKPQMWAYEGL